MSGRITEEQYCAWKSLLVKHCGNFRPNGMPSAYVETAVWNVIWKDIWPPWLSNAPIWGKERWPDRLQRYKKSTPYRQNGVAELQKKRRKIIVNGLDRLLQCVWYGAWIGRNSSSHSAPHPGEYAELKTKLISNRCTLGEFRIRRCFFFLGGQLVTIAICDLLDTFSIVLRSSKGNIT